MYWANIRGVFLVLTVRNVVELGVGGRVVGAACQKTRAAVDGPALRRIKRHSGLLTTLGALNRNFYALTHARCLRSGDGC